MESVLLSVQQVACILTVSESTVRRMEKDGKLPVHGNEKYRFDLSSILSINSQRARVKGKFTVSGIKAKDLKDAVEKLGADEENIMLIIEEFGLPGPIAGEYLCYPKEFSSISIYGKDAGKSWVI